jgi:hypothetical protein
MLNYFFFELCKSVLHSKSIDDDSLDIRRLDDYGDELHNLLKGDVCYYQT